MIRLMSAMCASAALAMGGCEPGEGEGEEGEGDGEEGEGEEGEGEEGEGEAPGDACIDITIEVSGDQLPWLVNPGESDGLGALHVYFLQEEVQAIDFSDAEATLSDPEVTSQTYPALCVPPGDWQVWVWLDDNADADQGFEEVDAQDACPDLTTLPLNLTLESGATAPVTVTIVGSCT